MSSRAACGRWAVTFLGVFTLLFAPATDELSFRSTLEAREALGARILAPTGSEAIESLNSKLADVGFRGANQRPEWTPLALLSAATGLLLLLVSLAGGLAPGRMLRLVASRSQAPRGPPGIEAV